MTAYELTIPAPCAVTKTGRRTALWITSNGRLYWREKARRTRWWRTSTYTRARNAGIPRLDRAHITATVHRARGGRFDPSNWADTAKAAVDGLVDAGVFDDDDHTRVTGPDMRAGAPRPEPCLVLTITAQNR